MGSHCLCERFTRSRGERRNLHKTVDDSKHNYETAEPDVDGSQFGGCLRFGIDPVMEKSKNELANETCYDDYANNLMRRIEILRLDLC